MKRILSASSTIRRSPIGCSPGGRTMTTAVTDGLTWQVDDDGDICAQGVRAQGISLEYIIDATNELAVFDDAGELVAIRANGCLQCAELMAEAIECCHIRATPILKFLDSAWVCGGNHP